MRGKKILAIFCAAILCCMNLVCVAPTLAEGGNAKATTSAEKEAAKKAEKEAKKKAEKEAKKKAEKEAKKKAEKEAKKKAEEEAAKKAEKEAKKKAEEEAAAKKAEEEEAAKKAEEEEAAKKAEEKAKKKAEKEAKKKAEEEAAKKAEEEAAKKAEEEAAKKAEEEAAKQAEEEAAKKAEEKAKKKAEKEAKKKAKEEEAAKKAEEEAAKKAEEEAAKQAEEPAEKPAEEPAEEPSKEPAEEPAKEPAEEPSKEPTEEPAKEPAGEPTEEPTEEPAEEPAEKPTEEPTEKPTEEPTEKPTEAPTPEEQGEVLPIEEDENELKLGQLSANHGEVKTDKKVKFTFKVENADKVTWKAVRSDGKKGGSGTASGSSFEWTPKKTGVYTVTVKATAGDAQKTASCQVIVRNGKLTAYAKSPTAYAMEGERDLHYDMSIKGGCEPYTVNVVVERNGSVIYMSDKLVTPLTGRVKGYGVHKLYLEVTDAAGDTASAKATIRAAIQKKNDPLPLPKLNRKMTFAERLVAVAESQVGYREVDENFILDEDRNPQGWSYYAAWYGLPYKEWCAMFVVYCQDKAGIRDLMGTYANCNRWRMGLGREYIDNEDEYIPEPGDLIFFHHDRVSKDPNFPNHVGIVTGYDPENEIVSTVEGNSGLAVRAKTYERSDTSIVGYVSIRKYMRRWDPVYRQRLYSARAEVMTQIRNRGKETVSTRE